ncbi:DNA repair protein RAD51 4 [Echinococcus multilocularis]|uniref:DNA repair protein RAD51 4 n=1 Tax=Echinococcus multilocularis TaxID=6211 RepID=A0A068Y528_ECHMU|nr:DNA repair protein RAD51 4 [Echinococcus multilocularis]
MSELLDPPKETRETSRALFKRLWRSTLLGQPLLPFLFHNTDFESSLLQQGTDGGNLQTSTSRPSAAYWDVTPPVPSPSSIFASKSLHTVQRLILKQWAPRAISGADLLKDCLANRRFLSTGFSQLDSLLNGGLMTGEITEVFGASAVGKTQICHSAAAAAAISSHLFQPDTPLSEPLTEARGPTVLYLDTKGEFDATRLRSIIRSLLKKKCHLEDMSDLEHSTNHCLSRIWHRLVPGVQGLMDGLVETRLWVASAALQETSPDCKQMSAEELNFYSKLRLVIVDCITAPFAPFIGPFPNETNFQLQAVATELRRISVDFHIAVLTTNNLRYGVEAPRGCLGEYWATVPHLSLHAHLPEPDLFPLRVNIAIRRNLRCTAAEPVTVEDSETPLDPCTINFLAEWEDVNS